MHIKNSYLHCVLEFFSAVQLKTCKTTNNCSCSPMLIQGNPRCVLPASLDIRKQQFCGYINPLLLHKNLSPMLQGPSFIRLVFRTNSVNMYIFIFTYLYIYTYICMHACITWHSITLHYLTLPYITLHSLTFNHITLHTYIIYIYVYVYVCVPIVYVETNGSVSCQCQAAGATGASWCPTQSSVWNLDFLRW